MVHDLTAEFLAYQSRIICSRNAHIWQLSQSIQECAFASWIYLSVHSWKGGKEGRRGKTEGREGREIYRQRGGEGDGEGGVERGGPHYMHMLNLCCNHMWPAEQTRHILHFEKRWVMTWNHPSYLWPSHRAYFKAISRPVAQNLAWSAHSSQEITFHVYAIFDVAICAMCLLLWVPECICYA